MCEDHVLYKLFEPLGPMLCWAKAKAVLGQAQKLRFGAGGGWGRCEVDVGPGDFDGFLSLGEDLREEY